MPITKGKRTAAGPDPATIAAANAGPGPSDADHPRPGGMGIAVDPVDPDKGPAHVGIDPRETAPVAHGPAEIGAKAAAPAADREAEISAHGKMPARRAKRPAPRPPN